MVRLSFLVLKVDSPRYGFRRMSFLLRLMKNTRTDVSVYCPKQTFGWNTPDPSPTVSSVLHLTYTYKFYVYNEYEDNVKDGHMERTDLLT